MRIGFVNQNRSRVGGAEVYLDSVVTAIAQAGHDVAFLCENDATGEPREPIRIPDGAPSWCTAVLGESKAFTQLLEWRPDVCFTHGLQSRRLENTIVQRFPSALYVHNYYGTCISGTKTHSTTSPECCDRRFSAACLFHYFPYHCGGSNPFTMWKLYRAQSQRLATMPRYRALIANSDHTSRELRRYGLKPDRVYYPLPASTLGPSSVPSLNGEVRLLFAARMTALKGGQYLLAALPDVQQRLQRRISVTMAGDGPDRNRWKQIADSVQSDFIHIDFPGWLSADALSKSLASAHLLVYPSVWPEPFGLSGLEAGLYGVPSVAFAVGGIPEWLHEGVNGYLAPVGVQALADAIVRSLSDSQRYAQLRAGASRRAHEYSLAAHLSQLLPILARCVR